MIYCGGRLLNEQPGSATRCLQNRWRCPGCGISGCKNPDCNSYLGNSGCPSCLRGNLEIVWSS